ncbi:MAG: H-NS histone family protein [Pseudomonas sp.]|nr:MAG: H-NS histone family protein [Pseudomonas sp.]
MNALMSKTYPELKIEMARLAAEAERVRAYELPTVIAEVNLQIERYQLTEAMIFGNARMRRPGRAKTVMVPKFVDQATGNTWTGRGTRPGWLIEALSAGTLAEHLLVS